MSRFSQKSVLPVLLALAMGCGQAPREVPPSAARTKSPSAAERRRVSTSVDRSTVKDQPEVASDTAAGSAAPDQAADLPEPNRVLLFSLRGPILVDAWLTINGRPHHELMEQVVTQVLQLAHTDGDGSATWDELSRSPHFVHGQFGNVAVRGEAERVRLVELYDVDRDAMVDRSEVYRFVTRNRGGARTFSVLSATGDSYTNQHESALRSVLDHDRDKQLSAHEISAASTHLRRLDSDDDELISLAELTEQPFVGVESSGTAMSNRGIRRRVGQPELAWLISDETAWPKLQFALEQHYGTDLLPPESSASALARELAALDQDGDRELLPAEIAALQDAPRHIGIEVHFVEHGPTSADGQPDDTDRLSEQPTARLLLRYCAPTFEQPSVRAASGGRPLKLRVEDTIVEFRMEDAAAGTDYAARAALLVSNYDTDHNGYLEDAEIPDNIPGISSPVSTIDDNENGKIEAMEIATSLQRSASAVAGQIRTLVRFHEDPLFAALDQDGDRQLSFFELSELEPCLAAWDRNQDSVVRVDEIPTALVVIFYRGDLSAMQVPATNLVAATSAADGPRWFDRMDTNGDASISWREFIGPAAHFSRLDADASGRIELHEAESE